VSGENDHIAWGSQLHKSHTSDLFLEDFDNGSEVGVEITEYLASRNTTELTPILNVNTTQDHHMFTKAILNTIEFRDVPSLSVKYGFDKKGHNYLYKMWDL
jgi:hypothetical protein